MRRIFLHLFLFLCVVFTTNSVSAQVQIVVPTGEDTTICDGAPLTLRAVNNGYGSHTLSMSDDVYSSLIPIGFSFNFYGTTYTNLVVSSNGYITFNSSSASGGSAWSIASGIFVNNAIRNGISGVYGDLYQPAGGTITYGVSGVAPYRRFVLTFCQVRLFSCTSNMTTFQIILNETTDIVEVHTKRKDGCTSWNSNRFIQGVENNPMTAGTPSPGRNFPTVWTVTTPDGYSFTPDATYASYSVNSIPFSMVPDSAATIYWYSGTSLIGTGPTVTVAPTVTTTYQVMAISCGDTSTDYVTVNIGTGPEISSFTSVDPSVCGACDGSITLYGLEPGSSDTIRYFKDGVLQPLIIGVADASGRITMNGLCAGTYDNITVKIGYCTSPPVGPIDITNPAFLVSYTEHTNPSVCGACDATITLHGLIPGFVDTVRLYVGTTLVSTTTQMVAPDSTILLTGLCDNAYTVIVKMNECVTPPVGPIDIVNPPFGISSTSYTNANCSACDGVISLFGMTPNVPVTISYFYNGGPATPLSFTTNAAGSVTLYNLCPGVYSNIIATLNDCNSFPVGPITISAPPLIPISVISQQNATECGKCNGSITIKGTPEGYPDTVWFNRNGVAQAYYLTISSADSVLTISGLCAGTYDNIFIKSGPCPSTTITLPTTLVDPPMIPAFDTSVRFGCFGDTVNFFNQSTSAGLLWYNWLFGDGYSDSSTNPVHIYANQGTYTATLYVTNHYCIDSVKKVLNLNHPVQAIFSPDDTIICQNVPFTYNNTSIGAGNSYNWSFGDGQTSTDKNPTHFYTNVGTYPVTLIATNFVPCSDTVTGYVTVDSFTQMSMTITDTVICAGTYMTFSGAYTNIGLNDATWKFGNGDSIKNVNPVVYAYPTSGSFNVSLTTTYRACPTTTVTRSVLVNPQPTISVGADQTVCEGSDPVLLIDNINDGNPAATWLWSTGATTSGIYTNVPGGYTCQVTVGNCSATDSVYVGTDCYMIIPNTFSPNKDGINDYFYPRDMFSKGLTKFSMKIYNRWGQMLFETDAVQGRGWDGNFNDMPQPEGVYVYIIDATFKDGKKEHRTGNITLMK